MSKDCLFEFSMTPLDKGESVSLYVSNSLEIIDNSKNIDYKLNPMGTVIEGTWDDCIGTITKCFSKMKERSNRVTCSIKIDYRKGKEGRLESKIQSVESKLQRTLNK